MTATACPLTSGDSLPSPIFLPHFREQIIGLYGHTQPDPITEVFEETFKKDF